jgi:hypothetical protein
MRNLSESQGQTEPKRGPLVKLITPLVRYLGTVPFIEGHARLIGRQPPKAATATRMRGARCPITAGRARVSTTAHRSRIAPPPYDQATVAGRLMLPSPGRLPSSRFVRLHGLVSCRNFTGLCGTGLDWISILVASSGTPDVGIVSLRKEGG